MFAMPLCFIESWQALTILCNQMAFIGERDWTQILDTDHPWWSKIFISDNIVLLMNFQNPLWILASTCPWNRGAAHVLAKFQGLDNGTKPPSILSIIVHSILNFVLITLHFTLRDFKVAIKTLRFASLHVLCGPGPSFPSRPDRIARTPRCVQRLKRYIGRFRIFPIGRNIIWRSQVPLLQYPEAVAFAPDSSATLAAKS